jgi:hypothetical protein
VPHWKPPPQLVHAIVPATGDGTGDGVVAVLLEHALIANAEAMISAIVRGFTERVYRANELRPGERVAF